MAMAQWGKAVTQVVKTLSVQSRILVRRAKLTMGTLTGVALTYGVYQTVLGGQLPHMIRALNEEPTTVSPNIQKPPFDMEALDDPPKAQHTEEAVFLDPREIPVPTEYPKSQPCVISQDKAHALFLWMRVKDDADVKQVASCAARLQQHVQDVEAPAIASCGSYHIFAGVGFGPQFYSKVSGAPPPQPFSNAKHDLLSCESVGGDILIHAKSNKEELLQLLAQRILDNMPEDSIQSHEETYGRHKDAEGVAKKQSGNERLGIINYQCSKGELELIPPKEPVEMDKPNLVFISEPGLQETEFKRQEAAVDPQSGGSYVMTQRWVHDIQLVDDNGESAMNDWVDRAWEECAGPPGERHFKSLTVLGAEMANISMDKWMSAAFKECQAVQQKHPESHIVCSPGSFTPQTPFRILRQSVPYKEIGGVSGLFFISYATTPHYNELLLDRLLASCTGGDKLNRVCRDVFTLSRNAQSASWYFPGQDELARLQ